MGNFHRDKKGYPRWDDSGLLVHKTVCPVGPGQVVHHKDGNKSNFRRENLKPMSRSSHSRLEARKKNGWF
jgi:hypothetical protein